MGRLLVRGVLLLSFVGLMGMRGQDPANRPETVPTSPAAVGGGPVLLKPADLAKTMPATVFFRGLSAPVQMRNSGGLLFPDKRLMMVSLVDTSGYSTSVQEKYQAYLLTEVALDFGGHVLAPGAYGCGFIAGDRFIVQDLGAHDLFTTASTRDAGLKRPTPLQLLVGDAPGSYRLYAGRSYVTVKPAAQ